MAKAADTKPSLTSPETTAAKGASTPDTASRPAQAAPVDPAAPNGTPPPAEAPKQALTADQKKGLWISYDSLDAEITKAEETIERCKPLRSKAVEAIVDGYGMTGPFERKDGTILNAAKMKSSTVDGVVIPGGYTFRTERQREAEKV